jgi:AcrR family transcriptional regulator
VATKAFASGKSVTLEAIAEKAGVGIGTLYRHFPTREALVLAVYRSELDDLGMSAEQLLRAKPAFEALNAWMDRFAQYVTTKLAMLEALRDAWASNPNQVSETRTRIRSIIARFVEAGVADGTIREVDPDDVAVSLSGILMATAGSKDRDQFRRLLALLAEGLRSARGKQT